MQSNLYWTAPYAGVAHLVERHLAKVEVASSSLVARSTRFQSSNAFYIGRKAAWPPPSANKRQQCFFYIRRVRQTTGTSADSTLHGKFNSMWLFLKGCAILDYRKHRIEHGDIAKW